LCCSSRTRRAGAAEIGHANGADEQEQDVAPVHAVDDVVRGAQQVIDAVLVRHMMPTNATTCSKPSRSAGSLRPRLEERQVRAVADDEHAVRRNAAALQRHLAGYDWLVTMTTSAAR
jgi:hypothetical protein